MSSERILITNIQRFSLHDGPGIRTTVFIKGCSLRCPWCSNPENISIQRQTYNNEGYEGVYGQWYEPEEIVENCLRDKKFYGVNNDDWRKVTIENIDMLPGGVTFSGGECLLQIDKLVDVCRALHNEKIHIACETCLFIQPSQLDLALEHIDFFYVDVKILDNQLCMDVENGELSLFLRNLDRLFSWTDEDGYYKPIVVRVPVIGKYTDSTTNRKRIYELLKKYRERIIKVELIKEHNMAKNKYLSLGLPFSYNGVDDEFMEKYKTELITLGIPIDICKI